jgi:transcriptional regulator with XRE-family HTH domain
VSFETQNDASKIQKHTRFTKAIVHYFFTSMEKTLGQQLTALREARSLTQDELADKSGVSRPQISRLENDEIDNPRRATLLKLAEALGTDAAALQPAVVVTRRPVAVLDPEAENLAQFENVVLREQIVEQNEKINSQAEQLTKLKAMVAYLNSELGKFGGSLEAALHGLVPTGPRAGALVPA